MKHWKNLLVCLLAGALLLDDSTAMTARLYAPQADSAAAELLDDAAGHSEMGAAFIDYNGTAYVVAVFR